VSGSRIEAGLSRIKITRVMVTLSSQNVIISKAEILKKQDSYIRSWLYVGHNVTLYPNFKFIWPCIVINSYNKTN